MRATRLNTIKKNKFCNVHSNYIYYTSFREDYIYNHTDKTLFHNEIIEKSEKAIQLLIKKLEEDSGLDLSGFEIRETDSDKIQPTQLHYRKEVTRLTKYVYSQYSKPKYDELIDEVLSFPSTVKTLFDREDKTFEQNTSQIINNYLTIIDKIKKSEITSEFKIKAIKKLSELYCESFNYVE